MAVHDIIILYINWVTFHQKGGSKFVKNNKNSKLCIAKPLGAIHKREIETMKILLMNRTIERNTDTQNQNTKDQRVILTRCVE